MQNDLRGKTLGQYRLDRLIGRGGMAAVYSAHQASLGRNVAVKVLPTAFAQDADFVARFRREARAVAQLDHPHILAIYDFGEQDGTTYIVMPLMTGGTLKDRVGAPLPFDVCAQMCAAIAQALGYAHERGIVHRDVKPSNILLGPNDWPQLADFGIARMVGETGMLTRPGVGIGTPEYMSPEQGRGILVDGHTDQYALAMMAFEMLTGRTAFRAESALATIMLHIREPVPSPRERNPNLSLAVDAVVRRGLAKRAEDRFPTITDFAEALQESLQRPPSRTSGVRRNRLDEHFQQAQQAHDRRDYAAAITSLTTILSEDPNYPQATELLARAQRAAAGTSLSQAAPARTDVRALLRATPDRPARPRRLLGRRAGLTIGVLAMLTVSALGLWRLPGAAGDADPPLTPPPTGEATTSALVIVPTPEPTTTPLPLACVNLAVTLAAADIALATGDLEVGRNALVSVLDCPGANRAALDSRVTGLKTLATAREVRASGDFPTATELLRGLAAADANFPGLATDFAATLLAAGQAALGSGALAEATELCSEVLTWAPNNLAATQCLVDTLPPSPVPTALPTATRVPPTATRPVPTTAPLPPTTAPAPTAIASTAVPQPVPSATLRLPPELPPTATLRLPPT